MNEKEREEFVCEKCKERGTNTCECCAIKICQSI